MNEIYINKNKVNSLRVHRKKLYQKIYKHYQKPIYFFGIKLCDGKEYYTVCEDSRANAYKHNSPSELFKHEYGNSIRFKLENDELIYKKPYCEIGIERENNLVKYFDDDKEMDEYLEKLNLEIMKTHLKLKYD